MKTAKIIRFYVLFTTYLVFSLLSISVTFGTETSHRNLNALGIFILIFLVGSPFVITKNIINKFFIGDNKDRFSNVSAIVISILTLFNIYGVYRFDGLNIYYIPYYSFVLFVVVSLLTYKSKN